MNLQNQKQVQKIQNKYQPRKEDKLEKIKELDKKVSRPAKIFAYVFGSLSSLVFGTGMCMSMKVIFANLHPAIGIGVGVLGMALCYLNYLIYKGRLNKGKKKYKNEILDLCAEALAEEN